MSRAESYSSDSGVGRRRALEELQRLHEQRRIRALDETVQHGDELEPLLVQSLPHGRLVFCRRLADWSVAQLEEAGENVCQVFGGQLWSEDGVLLQFAQGFHGHCQPRVLLQKSSEISLPIVPLQICTCSSEMGWG